MSGYKEMYYFLFNGITRIIDELQEKENNMKDMPCIIKLKKLQIDAEEMFISED